MKSFLTLLFSLIFVISAVIAEPPLSELMQSPEMHRFETTTHKGAAAKRAVWFEKGSNFASVFSDKKGPHRLIEWSAPSSSAYSSGPEKVFKGPEFVRAEKVYFHKSFGPATLAILIPHPKFAAWVDNRLIKEFSELEPPSLPVSHTETMSISEFPSVLYTHRSENSSASPTSPTGCSLLIKLSRTTFVNLSSNSCKEPTILTRLAEALDLKRLDRKINS